MLAIHYNAAIEWQQKRVHQFQEGLDALGIESTLTSSRQRVSDHAILFGTTFWKDIEKDGDFLLVDRASVGDPDYVSLVWNGHGRRGDHKVPEDTRGRSLDIKLQPYNISGDRIILCGQTETYSPQYDTVSDWYASVPEATHFKAHPAGDNPTGLRAVRDFQKAKQVITLNSSVAVECVIKGIPTVTMDEGSMAWDVTSHEPGVHEYQDRGPWLEWLAWTQWSWDEIEQGEPIAHLFEDIL